jgi:hypothetical protein
MYNRPVEFILEIRTVLYGILTNCINTYEEISRQFITFTVIECDDVCKIVMLKILLIDIQNIIIRTEDYGNVSYSADLTLCNKAQPTVIESFTFENEISVFKII